MNYLYKLCDETALNKKSTKNHPQFSELFLFLLTGIQFFLQNAYHRHVSIIFNSAKTAFDPTVQFDLVQIQTANSLLNFIAVNVIIDIRNARNQTNKPSSGHTVNHLFILFEDKM